MAFLDNSGDIILDAVLTDTGRMRLAKGDGSFNITKFALGDDEINYGLYDKNHPSGSAYFDIEILQTPVLEAFTNNASTMKSKLLSISRTNLLYLPEVRNNSTDGIAVNSSNNTVSVAVDDSTVTALLDSSNNLLAGIINGVELAKNSTDNRRLLFDQGMVSDALGKTGDVQLDADLVETQYIVEVDNRLARLYDPSGLQATPSFIDDDNIASYYISTSPFVTNLNAEVEGATTTPSVIEGPRGTKLEFSILASLNLRTSEFLFDQVGNTTTFGGKNIKFIDTLVRVNGATTGYRVDVPVRFVKKTN